MQFIRNLKITTRLIMGFSVILTLMVGITIVGITEVDIIKKALTQIDDVNSVKQRYAINFRGSVHDRSIAIRDVYLVTEKQELQATIADIRRLEEDYRKSAEKMDEIFATRDDIEPIERDILNRIKEIEAATNPLVEQVIELQTKEIPDAAYLILMQDLRPYFVDWLATINQFIDLQEDKNMMEADVAQATASEFTSIMIIATSLAILLGGLFAAWIIFSIRPLRVLTNSMQRLAENDLSTDIPDFNTTNEIGDITQAVLVFKENAIEVQRLEEEQRQAEIRNQEAQVAARHQMADQFDAQIGKTIEKLVSASTELQSISQNMGDISSSVHNVSSEVASSTKTTSENISTVASATEEMTASSSEITSQVSSVASKSDIASASASESSQKVNELNQLASNIGEVVTSIRDIADQTNLLALNATIESARAGEAGKGFAVVADEVKKLASETSQKTEEISARIAEIQEATQEAVLAMENIISNITEINQASADTASAADQQNSVISEITMNIAQVSRAAQETTTMITDIESASNEVCKASEVLDTSSGDIANLSQNLEEAVSSLLGELRKA
ncbi:methyl-accepting chemotaxis protein [Curvivirga sp.]|uniref:methyl-accepting chemotaxis protein n=1 Tax=Curvivirga sp. TaxID=2856848 RepID=UPI003B58C47E